MRSLWSDLWHSIRQLAKSPLITVAAILSLMLAIGANIAIFSLINALVLESLPISAPKHLVRLKLFAA
jgi:hypothetical protein